MTLSHLPLTGDAIHHGSEQPLPPVVEAPAEIDGSFDGNEFFHYPAGKQFQGAVMALLTVTAKGQVTLKRDLLQHLGIEPGARIDIEKLPNGELRVRAARPDGTVDGFLGLLAGRTRKVATIDELNAAAAAGWAGKK